MACQQNAGIMALTHGLTYDVAERLHTCEIQSVLRMYREKGSKHVKKFLLDVEKHRGSEAAQRLRNDALKALELEKRGKQ